MTRLTINREACIGCGSCESIAPEVFELDEDGKSKIKECKCTAKLCQRQLKKEETESAKEAADACPVEIIKVEED